MGLLDRTVGGLHSLSPHPVCADEAASVRRQARPSPLRALDNDEIRMTNVEGIPKSEDQMELQQALSRRFGFRDSGFFRHWLFVIRISVPAVIADAVLLSCAPQGFVQRPYASSQFGGAPEDVA